MITQRIIEKLQQVAAHERLLADNARTSETLAQLTTQEHKDEAERVACEADELADEAIEAMRLLMPHVSAPKPSPTTRRRGFRVMPGGRS